MTNEDRTMKAEVGIYLIADPLKLRCVLPSTDGDVIVGDFPLSVQVAQGLVLSLLAQPGVGGPLDPKWAEQIKNAGEKAAVCDAEFLRAMGVAPAEA